MNQVDQVRRQHEFFGLTDIELAKRAELEFQRFVRIKNGYVKPSQDEIDKLQRALTERQAELEKSGVRIHIAGVGRCVKGQITLDENEPAIRYNDE